MWKWLTIEFFSTLTNWDYVEFKCTGRCRKNANNKGTRIKLICFILFYQFRWLCLWYGRVGDFFCIISFERTYERDRNVLIQVSQTCSPGLLLQTSGSQLHKSESGTLCQSYKFRSLSLILRIILINRFNRKATISMDQCDWNWITTERDITEIIRMKLIAFLDE